MVVRKNETDDAKKRSKGRRSRRAMVKATEIPRKE